ncbi:MAG: haloacid dehalogenase-like hydrolase [Erysipelotrichaceae bacterium]|nr:haloacid dehalogenase-like hydrolase [Erysipelotrichaceae bacterium]MDO4415924.1 haloacid dehalogenase-like hydrolase [Erysipelotrichaceae bacterium]
MKKAAILYDFDKTLCTKDMQEYSLIPSLGYENAGVFWDEVTELTVRYKMDGISAYLYHLQKKFKEQGNPVTKDMFIEPGKQIELYPGVATWFKRINDYGRKAGLFIEHYIISSGMKEIIENTSISDEFRKIYACCYYYENGEAVWPAQVVNYTTKTQYIFRINKQILDESDEKSLNEYVEMKQRPVPFGRMVYVADGLTDVPCMRLVKEYGGKSIAVYNDASEKSKGIAKKLIDDGRANYMVKADYSANSDMEKLMKKIIDHMKADSELEELEGKYR